MMSSTTTTGSPALTDVDHGPTLVAVAWVFAAVAIVVVSFRCYVRLKIMRRFRLDDWFMLLTFALALCNSCFVTVAAYWGLGRHAMFLTPEQIRNSTKFIYLCEFYSMMSPCFGRISYALLLIQIVTPTQWRRRTLYVIIGMQFVIDIGCAVISYAQCPHVSDFWGPRQQELCWKPIVQQYTGYFQGSFCTVVDLILAVFPASLFWSLNMEIKTKISLSILMGLGIFSAICSIIKTIMLQALDNKNDFTYAMCKLAIWWTVEAYIVLLAASVPTLRPLVRGHHSMHNRKESKSSGRNALQQYTNHTIGSMPMRKPGHFFPLGDRTLSERSDEEGLAAPTIEAFDSQSDQELVVRDVINKTTTVEVFHKCRDEECGT